MKSKAATATKVIAILFLLFFSLLVLKNLILEPIIYDSFEYTWDEKQIFSNVVNLFIVLVNLIAIIGYLVCSSKKPAPIGLLIVPFILWFLAFCALEIKTFIDFFDEIGSYTYRYLSEYRTKKIIVFFITESFNIPMQILFHLGLYTLVPKTISDALTGGKKKDAPQQPAYAQPAYQQPAYQQPAQPAYTQRPAAPQQPVYQQPAYQQPAYQQPAYQPAYQQPAYQQRPAAPQQTYRQADDQSEETSYLPPDAQPPQA